MPLGKLVEHGGRDLLLRHRYSLLFETSLAIRGILGDHRCDEVLVGDLHPSGVAAMALRYSQTSNVPLDVQEADS